MITERIGFQFGRCKALKNLTLCPVCHLWGLQYLLTMKNIRQCLCVFLWHREGTLHFAIIILITPEEHLTAQMGTNSSFQHCTLMSLNH